jgi:hypothetical protein
MGGSGHGDYGHEDNEEEVESRWGHIFKYGLLDPLRLFIWTVAGLPLLHCSQPLILLLNIVDLPLFLLDDPFQSLHLLLALLLQKEMVDLLDPLVQMSQLRDDTILELLLLAEVFGLLLARLLRQRAFWGGLQASTLLVILLVTLRRLLGLVGWYV